MTKDSLEHIYETYGGREAAKILGVSHPTLLFTLKKQGIPIKPVGRPRKD